MIIQKNFKKLLQLQISAKCVIKSNVNLKNNQFIYILADLKITSYLECKTCAQQLTLPRELDKAYYEYSFHRFIQHLMLMPLPKEKKFDGQCNHYQPMRVFEYDDMKMKLFSGDLQRYKLIKIELGGDYLIEKRTMNEKKIANERKKLLVVTIDKEANRLKVKLEEINSAKTTNINLEHFNCEKLYLLIEEFIEKIKTYLKQETLDICNLETIRLECFLELWNLFQIIFSVKTTENTVKRNLVKRITHHIFRIGLKSNKLLKQGTLAIDHMDSPSDETSINDFQLKLSPKLSPQFKRYSSAIYENATSEDKKNISQEKNQSIINEDDGTPTGSGEFNINQDVNQEEEIIKNQYSQLKSQSATTDQNAPINLEVEDLKLLGSGFPQLESYALLNFDKKIFKLLSVQQNLPLSAVGFALNSIKYLELLESEGFQIHSNLAKQQQFSESFTEFLKQKLFVNVPSMSDNETLDSPRQMPKSKSSYRHIFKFSVSDPVCKINKVPEARAPTNLEFIDTEASALFQELSQMNVERQFTAKVSLWYPVQFEALRQLHGITLPQFIHSLILSKDQDTTGGKSNASFYLSCDDLLLIKEVEYSELKQFTSISDRYFEYLKHNYTHTLLAKIFGVFEVKFNREKRCFIAMENIKLGMETENIRMYDLKGSLMHRFAKKEKSVGLDTNFRVDLNGEPFILDNNQIIQATLAFDSKFLASQDRIDYSLLVVVEVPTQNQTEHKNKIRMGIIDYLQNYNILKKGENIYKTIQNSVTKGGAKPTIVNPSEYQKRFVQSMGKYFVGIE